MSRVGFAGIDVGGGGLRIRAESTQMSIQWADAIPMARCQGIVDIPLLASRIVAAIEPIADELDIDGFEAVGIGLTGLPGLVEDPGELALLLSRAFRIGSIVVAGDAVTTHVGALKSSPGVVVAAGTGAIALGTDFDRVWNRVDGWGLLLGDEGGGAWVGMRGLRAALRAKDGRPGGSHALLELMVEHFGYAADLIAHVYKSQSAHRLASFAPAVARAARLGDSVAAGIWDAAATHLAEAAVAASRGLEPRFSWGGRLFDAGSILLDPFIAETRRMMPTAQFLPPSGTSTDGALSIAREHFKDPMRDRPPYLYVFSNGDSSF